MTENLGKCSIEELAYLAVANSLGWILVSGTPVRFNQESLLAATPHALRESKEDEGTVSRFDRAMSSMKAATTALEIVRLLGHGEGTKFACQLCGCPYRASELDGVAEAYGWAKTCPSACPECQLDPEVALAKGPEYRDYSLSGAVNAWFRAGKAQGPLAAKWVLQRRGKPASDWRPSGDLVLDSLPRRYRD